MSLPKFSSDKDFTSSLKREVDNYFENNHIRKRDVPKMYFKSFVILVWFFLSYVLLMSQVSLIGGLICAVSLALAATGVAFCIQHDGGHKGYSNRKIINRLTSWTLDMVGASSYLWHYKHSIFHHTYTNIENYDTDISVGKPIRLSPYQERKWYHRWQHLYSWPLYAFMGVRWHLYGDYHDLAVGSIGPHKIERPKGLELAIFVSGKSVSTFMMLALPMFFFYWWLVIIFYLLVTGIMSLVMATVFQLAHVVDKSKFVLYDEGLVEDSWMVHQIKTTVNFSRKSRLMTWYLGGLNYQIEHHLFPRICHVHYPELSRIVEQKCLEYEIPYNDHGSFWDGIKSHYRWLKKMGNKT